MASTHTHSTCLIWHCSTPAPTPTLHTPHAHAKKSALGTHAGRGRAAAARTFAEVFALTWAGSQITKIPRAAGAVFLAPFVDKGLDKLQGRLRLRSRNQVRLCGRAVVWGARKVAQVRWAFLLCAW